jgi:ABC-2 type transport system permease protein
MTTTLNAPERGTRRAEPMPERWHGTGVATQVLVLTGRSLRAIARDPRLIVFSLLQPLVMLALFSQVFSSMARTPGFPAGVSYINYLLPAILVTTGIGSALQSGVGLVTDMKSGVLARFRSLPIRLGSVLVARSLADLVRAAGQLLLMVFFATVLFGFSPAGGWAGVAGALLLGLAVSWGLAWVFLALASWLRNAETMQSVGFLAMFPLMFASSAYVPLSGLPGWLRAIAKFNPLTYAVDAARNLALGMPVGTGVLAALFTSLLIALLGMGFAIPGFRRP